MKKYILLVLVLSLSVIVFSGCGNHILTPDEPVGEIPVVETPTTELPNKAKLGIEVPEDTLLVGFGFDSSSSNVSYLIMTNKGEVSIYSCDLDVSNANTLGEEINSFALSRDVVKPLNNISTKVGKFVEKEENQKEEDGFVTKSFAGVKYFIYNSKFSEGLCIDYTGELSERIFDIIDNIDYEGESLTSLTMSGVK